MSNDWKILNFFIFLTLFSAAIDAELWPSYTRSEENEFRGKCKVCDDINQTDDNCALYPMNITTECDADFCFTNVSNNGHVSRGCANDAFACSDVNCVTCFALGPACNTKPVKFTCKTCDSKVDKNCAQWLDPEAIISASCLIERCMTFIRPDGHTERRCGKPGEPSDAGYELSSPCYTNGCNTGVFPETRRRCYQCDASTKCANPMDYPSEVKSLPCPIFIEEEQCLAYSTSETEMVRGCRSNLTANTACIDANEKCVTCTTDSCNFRSYKYSQSLKCIQCNSESNDCAWGHEKSGARNCAKQIAFYETEGCYTNKTSDGKVERGCIHDNSNLSCATTPTCEVCTDGDGCNNADQTNFTCYTCHSQLNPACAKPLENDSFTALPCRNPVNAETKGCYVEKWKGAYIRSCLVDADVTTQEQCLGSTYTMCDSCSEKDCNSDMLKNSAASTAAGVFVLIAPLTLLRLLWIRYTHFLVIN